MRIVFMGTGPFAVPSFQAIYEKMQDQVVLCVTKPQPAVTGKGKVPPNPVLDWATTVGLPIYQPSSINLPEAVERLSDSKADLHVVCDYGQILSGEALATSRFGGINLHGSLLPRHRGAAPVQWSVLRGDLRSGVSVIHMSPRLDAGPILTTRETDLLPGENAGELEKRLAALGVSATLEAIDQLRAVQDPLEADRLGSPQDSSLSTNARRLAKQDGELDFRYSSSVLDRLVRGLQPWPGAYGELIVEEGKTLRLAILKAIPIKLDVEKLSSQEMGLLLWGDNLKNLLDHSTEGGTSASTLCKLGIVCRDGLLGVETLQPAGKRAMTATEFLMGYQRHPKMVFQQPSESNRLLKQLEG